MSTFSFQGGLYFGKWLYRWFLQPETAPTLKWQTPWQAFARGGTSWRACGEKPGACMRATASNPIPLLWGGFPGPPPDLLRPTHVCGTARGARMLFSLFHHMGTVRSYVRPVCAVMTAGLDEVREAGGWIKGARFVRVMGFGLSCFGISSRGSSSVVHLTCRRLPGSSCQRSCAYAVAGPALIPVGSR